MLSVDELIAKKKKYKARSSHHQTETKRVLIVDSGATLHVVDLHGISDAERRTMRKLETPILLLGINGIIKVEYECDVWIFELQMIIPAMLFPGSPAVLSMGKLVKVHGFEMRWKHPSPLTLTRDDVVVQCWLDVVWFV